MTLDSITAYCKTLRLPTIALVVEEALGAAQREDVIFRAILGHVFSPKGGHLFSPKGGHLFSPKGGHPFSPKGGHRWRWRKSSI